MSQWEQVLELEHRGGISLYVPFFPLQSDQAYLGQQLCAWFLGFGGALVALASYPSLPMLPVTHCHTFQTMPTGNQQHVRAQQAAEWVLMKPMFLEFRLSIFLKVRKQHLQSPFPKCEYASSTAPFSPFH